MSTQIAYDGFNRADGSLGANWTDLKTFFGTTSTIAIASHKAVGYVGGDYPVAIWKVDALDDDQYAEVTFSNTGNVSAGVMVRANGTDNTTYPSGYAVSVRSTDGLWNVSKQDGAGSGTVLDSGTLTYASGTALRLEAEGTTIRFYYGGSLLSTITGESTHTSGYAGILIQSDDGKLDDWSAGNLSTPTALAYDTFVDVDGTDLTDHTMDIGSGWTQDATRTGAILIHANRAAFPADTSSGVIYTDAGETDYTATVDLVYDEVSTDNPTQGGFVFRYTDDANYWLALLNYNPSDGALVNRVQIWEISSGSFTIRDEQFGTFSYVATWPVTLVVSGTSASFTVNGTTASYDSMATGLASTNVGFWLRGESGATGMSVDNFLVTTGGGGGGGIAFDSATDGTNNGGTGSLTFNHTFGSLTNGYAVIAIMRLFDDNITSVTVDGNAADHLVGPVALDTGNHFGHIYGIPVGTISGAKSVSISAGTNQYILAGVSSYDGVDQDDPVEADTDNQDYGSSNSITGSIDTTVDGAWGVICGFRPYDGDDIDAGTGAVERAEDAAFFEYNICDSDGSMGSAGTHTLGIVAPLNILGAGMIGLKPDDGMSGGSTRYTGDLGLLGIG